MLSYDIHYHLCRSFYSEETAVDHQIPIVQIGRIVIGIFLMILPSGLIDLHDRFFRKAAHSLPYIVAFQK